MNETLHAELATDDGCRRIAASVGETLGLIEAERAALADLLFTLRHADLSLLTHMQSSLQLYATAAARRERARTANSDQQ